MEKKISNTYGGISKSVLDRLNRNYQYEPIKDLNRIDEIMSVFIQGELNSIESILNDPNQILNFKDRSNQTLIHAIIRNESPNITEEKKLYIIRRLIDNKNVSIHTMNNIDQNPLHLACQKGYTSIISHLIENNCDQELIDTYGNTPIHYLVDKFVRDCGENDFYSQTNKQIKTSNSSNLKKINKILKNESLLIFYELFGLTDDSFSVDVGSKGNLIVSALKKFICNKIQGSLPEFYELLSDKIKKINEIFGDFSINHEIKLEKAKKIIFTTNDEVFKIYNIDAEFTNVVWNDFLLKQNYEIKKKKDEMKRFILSDIENIKKLFEQKIKVVLEHEIINKIYLPLTRFMAGTIYFDNFINCGLINNLKFAFYNDDVNELEVIKNDDDQVITLVNDAKEKVIFNRIRNEIKNKIIDKLLKKEFKIFLNGINDINNIDSISAFNSNFANKTYPYYFCYDETNINCDEYIEAYITPQNLCLIPSELKHTDITNYKNMKKTINESNFQTEKYREEQILSLVNSTKQYYIYSAIRILVEIIGKNITIICSQLENLNTIDETSFIKSLQQYYLFDIKYLSEIIFKIINNIIILEKYLYDFDLEELMNTQQTLKKAYRDLSTKFNDDFKHIMKHLQFFIKQILLSANVFDNIKNSLQIFDGLYDANIDILDILTNLIKKINKYFSYDQLEKYNEYLSENINLGKKTNDKIIPNTIFNNYSFKVTYPLKYKQYKNLYFSIKENINLYNKGVEDLSSITNSDNTIKFDKLDEFLTNPNYKKNMIEQNFSYNNTYDFNMFYLNSSEHYKYYVLKISENVVYKNLSFRQFIIKDNKYPITNYEFFPNQYKFTRGYDVLPKDVNGNLNIIKDTSGNLISGKNEINTFCNMYLLNKYSDFNSSINSVKENTNKIVSWNIVPEYKITNIDKLDTYIITNEMNSLMQMLAYMIYKIIEPYNISEIFFKKGKLNFFDKDNNIIETFIGVDLNNVELDETSKINVLESLSYISMNDEKRKEYLFDNIKIFIKTIIFKEINKQIFKIMDKIKIMNSNNEEQLILSSKTIDAFNKELKEIDIKYQKDFWKYKLSEYVRNLDTSNTLEFQEILNLSVSDIDINKISQKDKIIGSRCLNIQKTNELMKINKINYKVLDSNGNTILIKLMEQFNVYGIKKILEEKKILSTYKNKNMETPMNYLFNLVKNIQLDYNDDNIKQRLERYSMTLENTIKTSKQFDGIELSNANDLVTQIILNSIYLFNQTLWLKIYSYPVGWDAEDKKNLKKLLDFKEEKLLINSFDNNDNNKYLEEVKHTTENKISLHIKILEKEIDELKNRSNALKTESEDDIIKKSITEIDDINKKIKEKQEMIDKYKKINIKKSETSMDQIDDILNKYSTQLLDTTNLSIKWIDYSKLVNELDDKYLKIIRILDDKCLTVSSISNHILKIFKKNIFDNNCNKLIGKYLKLIFASLFNDYWDLDRYEDSEYNTINNSIIEILKINVVSIIKNEFINTLSNYIIQINENKNETSNIIKLIKNNNDLKQSIQIYLNQSLIIKLGLSNPDKPNPQTIVDEQKTIIINLLNKILGGQLDNVSKDEINKIMEFNKFVCENIGFNSYDEIIKILFDGKKLSLYYEIYDELNKALN